MNYKGYEAMIEFDDEDRLFVGRVINMRDVIVFDGLSVDELDEKIAIPGFIDIDLELASVFPQPI